MRNVIWSLLVAPIFCVAQEHGIRFLQDTSWESIEAKAKVEHKFIFVDCYASWCGPCKWMDKNVYTNDTVGEIMNEKFICIKLQMDSTKQDPEAVKRWYATAHELERQYQITAYPSFLFFSWDGQALHKAVGAKDIKEFMDVAQASMDSHKQFYILLAEYRKGTMDFEKMPGLSNAANQVGYDSLSVQIARSYLHQLAMFPDQHPWTKDNIAVVNSHTGLISSTDPIYKRYLASRTIIDSIIGQAGYTDQLINAIAFKEEVKPKVDEGVKDSTDPDWRMMRKAIRTKFGANNVETNILRGKIIYYAARKKWGLYARYFVRQVEMADVEHWTAGYWNMYYLNHDAFTVFQYSKSKKELKEALSWINKAIDMSDKPNANELDTKANLLYKLGKKKEALVLEQESCRLNPRDKEIAEAYNKMKNGLPTWE